MPEKGTGMLQKVVYTQRLSDYLLTNIVVCAESKSKNGVSGTNHLPTLHPKYSSNKHRACSCFT